MSAGFLADALQDYLALDEVRSGAQVRTRVGPNAILQTRAALDELCGYTKRDEIFDHAGLGWLTDRDLHDMVPAHTVNLLNCAVRDCLSWDRAEAVMARAGTLTADYIIANRIPGAAQKLLAILPERLAVKVLLKAIARNAWTFAGSSSVVVSGRTISIHNNPICLGSLGFDGCIWHCAVFSRLFQRLIDDRIEIRETECFGMGGLACVFEIER